MSVMVVNLLNKALFNRLTPLTLITNLLTNRLNNKYIFRPRSVVSVSVCVVARACNTITLTYTTITSFLFMISHFVV